MIKQGHALVVLKEKNKPHKWTDEELSLVRCDYQGTRLSARDLAQRLGISYWQVHFALEGMGLSHRWNERYWAAREDKYLTNNYDKLTTKQICQKLKRSKNSVVIRMKRLKLNRRLRDGWYTMNETCEILGHDHRKITQWIETGKLKATYHHDHKPQKNGSGYWHIDRNDLKKFICKYPQELIGRNVDIIQITDILAGLDYETS